MRLVQRAQTEMAHEGIEVEVLNEALPVEPAAQFPNSALLPPPQQSTQRKLDRFALGLQARRAQDGSVLRGEDDESSDLDLLVEPTADTTRLDVASIEVELRSLLGVPLDVLTPGALPDKFRANALAEAIAA